MFQPPKLTDPLLARVYQSRSPSVASLCPDRTRLPSTALTQKVLSALELHAMHEHPFVRLAPYKARLVHGGIKIRGAADVPAVRHAVTLVLLV